MQNKNEKLGAKKPAKNDINSVGLGQPMPQNAGLEQAVLGAMMLDSSAYLAVQSGGFALNETDFYSERHAAIWVAMEQLGTASHPIDLLTVSDRLGKNGMIEAIGGAYYLVELTNRIASSANVEFHAQVLKTLSIRRGLIQRCSAAITAAYDSTIDALDTLDFAQLEIASLSNFVGKQQVDLGKLTLELYDASTRPELYKKPTPTGFFDLDNSLEGGIFDDDYITLLAGRPGSGKTAFALGMVYEKMKQGLPVAFFSYEMTAETLLRRLWAIHTEIDHARIRKQQLMECEKPQLLNARNWFAERQHLLNIFDCTGMTLGVLIAKIRKAKSDGIVDIYIDHFGEIPRVAGQQEEQSNETKILALRDTAKAFNLRICLLAQFRKAGNGLLNMRPQMSDIKGNSRISECVSIILFLHKELGEDGGEKMMVIREKCRNAQTGDVEMGYNGSCYKWESLGLGSDIMPENGRANSDKSDEETSIFATFDSWVGE